MSYAVKRFFEGALTTTLTTALYTNGGGVTSIVTDVVITNTNATTSRAVTLAMPGSGAANQIFAAVGISPGETIHLECHQILLTGETITGGQVLGTDVTLHISGVEGT